MKMSSTYVIMIRIAHKHATENKDDKTNVTENDGLHAHWVMGWCVRGCHF